MNINSWLNQATKKLIKVSVSSARLDTELILTETLQKPREYLLAHPDDNINPNVQKRADKLLRRRIKHEPLAYIVGKKEFYGRDFIVTSDVLIPRPESESFIDLLKKLKPKTVIDIGTGPGCLAITAKLEFPNTLVIATDIDEKALKIARSNAKMHKVEIEFIKSDLLNFPPSIVKRLTSTVHRPSSIIANLPYVPDNLITSPEIEKEPSRALFSGKDGLDHYRDFWQQIAQQKTKPQYILTESLQKQHQKISDLALTSGYKLQKTDLLVQLYSAANTFEHS